MHRSSSKSGSGRRPVPRNGRRSRAWSRRLAGQWLEQRIALTGGPWSTLDAGPIEAAGAGPPSMVQTETTYRALDAGDSFTSAANLGEVAGRRVLHGRVGWSDTRDVIRFETGAAGRLTVALTGLRADLDLALADVTGRSLAVANRPGRSAERIELDLPAGAFYLVVDPWNWWGSTYSLTLDYAPESLAPSPLPGAVPGRVDSIARQLPDPSTAPSTRLAEVPDSADPRFWSVDRVGAPEAWAQGITGQGVVVAVVDTGVDLGHADLMSNLWVNADEIPGNGLDDDQNGFVDDARGWDFVDQDGLPQDGNGHGTHVAGTIAALNNRFGATGVAPNATVMPVRVLGNDGSGTMFDVAAGIRYAAANGAQVINLSLGGGWSRAIEDAIRYAGQLGALVVAAAGNAGGSAPAYPARLSAIYDTLLSVGASSQTDVLAHFSNRVGASGAVQVDAPGVGIYSTVPSGQFAWLSGTSMASPHVAGLAALVLNANPTLSARDVRSVIVSGAQRSTVGSDSVGLIDARWTIPLAYRQTGGAMVARPQPDGASIGTLPVASRNSLHHVVRRTAFDVQGVQIAGGIVGRLFDVSAPFQASIRTAPARKIDSAAAAHDQSGRRTSRDVHDSVAWAVRVDSVFSEELDVSPDRLGQSASERLPVRFPGSQLTGAPEEFPRILVQSAATAVG